MVALNDSAAALSALVPTAPRDLITPRSVQTWANSFEAYWASSIGRCNTGLLQRPIELAPVTEADFVASCLPEGGFTARTESKRFRRYSAAELLTRPKTSLNLKAHLAPELGGFGSPKEIASEVADRLDEAAARFRQVAEALPGQ